MADRTHVATFRGRPKGSIGVMRSASVEVTTGDAEHALYELYELGWEHITELTLSKKERR